MNIAGDIERKCLEEALRQKEERLETILEATSDAIVTLDLQDIITSVNRATEVILKYSREEFIGKPFDLFVTPESAALARERTEKALRGELLPPIFELAALRKDGARVPLEAKARFLYEKEKPAGLVCVLRDITYKKELEQQKADFLAMLTHDIKNPLEVISGYAWVLREMGGLSPEQKEMVKRQEMSVRTVLSLVNNYLDFSKIEAGRPTLVKGKR